MYQQDRGTRGGARRRRWIGSSVVVVALVVLAACEPQVTSALNGARATAGAAALPTNAALGDAARAHARAMCASGSVMPSNAPTAAYGEGPFIVHELVGRAALDPTITDPVQRNVAAADAVWAEWQTDPELTEGGWIDHAAGETQCPDGYLYETLVLRKASVMPASGLYSTQMYPWGSGLVANAIQYGSAVDYSGTTVPLLLDLRVPPVEAPVPHPALVLIHGGAFVGGSRSDYAGLAQSWSALGYAVIAIDYRLDPRLNGPHTALDQLTAAANAIADAQEAVRWLRAHATTYGIDTTRIAAIGDSAGGAIALGLSAVPDAHPATPHGTYSASVAAAVSTGAYLTPGLDAGLLQLHGTEAPILMFHYETDVASAPGPYAYRTCTAYRDAGDTCDYVSQAGEGHTTDLGPGGRWWANPFGSFLWQHLRLGP